MKENLQSLHQDLAITSQTFVHLLVHIARLA